MILLLILLILVIAVLLYKHFFWKADPWPEGGLKPPSYQGHRGYWKGGAQENSLASFKAAKERGLQMVEMDVRLSKDGHVVVFHDDDLKRIIGDARRVEDVTAAELERIANIPTLREVLLSKDVPPFLNIELKTNKSTDRSLEAKVVRVIHETESASRILFSSFNPLAIRELHRLLPKVPRALLATKEKDPTNRWYLKLLVLAPYIHANILHLDHRFVSTEDLRKYVKRGIPVSFWTVNEQSRADELLANGAQSIISDTLVPKV
ncbi:glycerophosphodiester phosphodiesterase [Bdellovibrio sp. HCB185ZH]|uniref:glycerophosphodiester phosphodiesterase n=1 Tax=Bdellovibrio sp. HCB185ZH TaxID=3394235 RepID=UPI0039A5BFD9